MTGHMYNYISTATSTLLSLGLLSTNTDGLVQSCGSSTIVLANGKSATLLRLRNRPFLFFGLLYSAMKRQLLSSQHSARHACLGRARSKV
jgi:hypothetical protein